MTAPVTTGAAGGTVAAAMAARAAQLAIRAHLLSDVVKLWPMLDAKRLDKTWPGWLAAMRLVTRSYHGQSSAAAGRFYQAQRAHAIQSPTPRSIIKLAPAPDDAWLGRAFGFSGPGMLSKDTAQPGTALSTTLGTAARVVLDGGRTTVLDTVAADPVALGWYRVTDGDPCAFCALLASRGMVYKEDTVGFQAHNDCGCTSAPAFTHNPDLPAISVEANNLYYSGNPDLVEFRKAWNNRNKPA